MESFNLETDQVTEAVEQGREWLWCVQRETMHWCGLLECNAGITAQYIMLHQALGKKLIKQRKRKLENYFRTRQEPSGGWGKGHRQDNGDVSLTAEVYLACRIMGIESTEPFLKQAETYILQCGGLSKVCVFTRIHLALFGLWPWDGIPVTPVELILLPKQSKINIYNFSSWARFNIVPLCLISHHRPTYPLPNGRSEKNTWLDHLWEHPENKMVPYVPPLMKLISSDGCSWSSFFGVMDKLLQVYTKVLSVFGLLRSYARKKSVEWILTHQEEDGDWGGSFPPMMYGILALTLEGYSVQSSPVERGLAAIERFGWEDSESFMMQACVSPVWDTVLAGRSLVDCGTNLKDKRLVGAVQWIAGRQLLVNHGDWKEYRPELRAGGWSFQYHNSWYPDVDDTAAVLLFLLKQDTDSAFGQVVQRGVEWIIGMQNRDGGWAAFDVDNDHLFLNTIPFSDMDSLCDPSSPDVAGRVLEAFGLLLRIISELDSPQFPGDSKLKVQVSMERGMQYLRGSQESDGSWYGRWGLNYIFGTSNVLCGLSNCSGTFSSNPMVTRALEWLKACQNEDGSWGEAVESYSHGILVKGAPTASQTAWALMGLIAFLPAQDTAIMKGVNWLITTQTSADCVQYMEGGIPVPAATRGSTWKEPYYTGTGFPNHLYLRYHYYSHYFPMMALGRYLNSVSATTE